MTDDGTWEQQPSAGRGHLPDPDGLRIPDTIEEIPLLRVEAALLRAELASLAGAQPRHRSPWGGALAPLLGMGLLLAAMLGALAAMTSMAGVAPRAASDEAPRAQALGSPMAPTGSPGGLLPNVVVEEVGADGSTRPVAARSLRPVVLALLPHDCRCEQLLDDLALQSTAFRVPLGLVGPPERRLELEALDRTTGTGASLVLLDDGDLLRSLGGLTTGAEGTASATAGDGPDVPIVLVVGPDGLLHAVERADRGSVRLEGPLARVSSGIAPGGPALRPA